MSFARAVRILAVGLAAGSLVLPGRPLPAAPEGRDVEASGLDLVTRETQVAIDRGLKFLAARQHDNGAFGSGSYRQNVAVTALCGMAFLSAGHTPGRGEYGATVQKAVDYVLARTRPNGYIIDEQSKYHGPMYGHGFATMFLAEVYGMSPGEEVREKLERAVNLIVNTQNAEGGWRYDPAPVRYADVSVTVCQLMALRSARNAGVSVPKSVIDKCVEYIKRCQNADGGFRYQLTGRADSQWPRSAAALVGLYSAGIYEGREIDRGLDYLMRFLPRSEVLRHDPQHYFYGHYYAVQAMWHAGDDYWYRWYPAIRDRLVSQQLPTGGWDDRNICTEHGTSMSLLVLQMPNNYLPIFQR